MGRQERQPGDPSRADARRAACAAAYFRAVADGYLYRAPNPRVFGRAKHYIVDDAQRDAILDVLAPAAPNQTARLGKAVGFGAIFLIGLSLATGLCAIYAAQFPAAGNVLVAVGALLVPTLAAVLATTHRLASLQLRQLRPILANARPSAERITNADVLWSLRSSGTEKAQRRGRIIGGAVAGLSAAAFLGAASLSWPKQGDAFSYAQPAFLLTIGLLTMSRILLAFPRIATATGIAERKFERGLTRTSHGVSVIFVAFMIGYLALRLTGALPPDYQGMRARAEIAAANGDAEAMGRLGWIYWQGKGVARDYGRAQGWYQQAAAAGNSGAMVTLAVFYESGLAEARDYAKARVWFERAAASGNATAMDWLGWNSQNGLGVPKDYAAARQWFEQAAAAGSALAQHHLAMLAYNGWGVPQDYNHARALLLKAAAAGQSVSMDQLGIMSINGFGTAKDAQAARGWYEKAAGAGSLSGMQHLATMLDKGEGGPADAVRAAHLLLASAKLGHAWSRTVLAGPLSFLTPETRTALKEEFAALGRYSGTVDDRWDDEARAVATAYLRDPR